MSDGKTEAQGEDRPRRFFYVLASLVTGTGINLLLSRHLSCKIRAKILYELPISRVLSRTPLCSGK